MFFSVGDGGGALVVVVVVVVVVDGACPPLLPHPAVSVAITIRVPLPTTATKRRVNGFELIGSHLAMRLLYTSYAVIFQRNSKHVCSIFPGNSAMTLIRSQVEKCDEQRSKRSRVG
jgi:hypothetical protein